MKKATILLVLFVLLAAAGCETVKGAGRDIQNTGENIQEGASKV